MNLCRTFFNRRLYCRWFITLILLFVPIFVHSAPIPEVSLNHWINQQLPHASVGVYVTEAETGKVLYRYRSSKLMTIASGMKLFIAAAALYQWKPDDHFMTALSTKNNDVYITFSGSPSLTINQFKDLLSHLSTKGIKTIQGNIILDISRFQPPYYLNGVSFDDLGWYYNAPDTAVILNGNAVTYKVIPTKIGTPLLLKAEDPSLPLRLINQVITVNQEEASQHCNFNIAIEENNTLRLFGCQAVSTTPRLLKLAVPEPILFAKHLIKQSLKNQHIALKGKILTGKTPATARTIAYIPSDDIVTLVTHMLQESDNVYANSLTKQLGFIVMGQGTYIQGMYAIKKILNKQIHLDTKQMVLADSVGTRYNLVSAEQIVHLLSALYHNPDLQKTIIKALPQAGASGTLKDRMKTSPLAKHLYAKTGSMHDVSSLSGFIIMPQTKPIIFSIIVNGIHVPAHKVKQFEEALLLKLYEIQIESDS